MFISKEAEVICNSIKNNFGSWIQHQPGMGASSYFAATDSKLPQMIIVYTSTNIYLVNSYNGKKVENVSNLYTEQIERVKFNWWDTFRIGRILSIKRIEKNDREAKEKKQKEKKVDLEVRERFNKIMKELNEN